MKTKIILVRHGETEWNLQGRFQGIKDTDLTETGLVQASKVAQVLKGSFEKIYTSPLKRAYETAEIIGKDNLIKPIIIDKIKEIDFGQWEGLSIKEIKEDFPKEFKLWREDGVVAPLCGGDLSLKNASLRAKEAILQVAYENKGGNIVIVAHGGIIKAGLIGIFDWDMTMYHKMILGNTSICEVIFNEDFNPILSKLNDTNHLTGKYLPKSYV